MKEVKLKCPKCRFKFVDSFHNGLTELFCVCPRCGTPFSDSLKNEELNSLLHSNERIKETEVSQDLESNKSLNSKYLQKNNKEKCDISVYSKVEKQNIYDIIKTPSRRQKNFSKSLTKHFYQTKTHTSKTKGCYVIFTVFFICVSIFIWLLASLMDLLDKNREPRVVSEIFSEVKEYSISANKNETEGVSISKNIFNSVKSEPIPQWLEGYWQTETDYGLVSLIIQNNLVTEETTQGKSQGSFFYKNCTLFCSFPENTSIVYKVDVEKRRIHLGGSSWFVKTKR